MKRLSVCFLLLFAAGVARADYLILPGTDSKGTFGPTGVIFQSYFDQSVGTGVFAPFWRAKHHGGDDDYAFFNTDYRPLDGDLSAGNNANAGHIKNRTFLINTLLADSGYFVFILDTNESQGGTAPLLSLDQFRLWAATSNTINTFATLSTHTLIYDMDLAGVCTPLTNASCTAYSGFDNGVLVDDEVEDPGSGKANLVVLVPTSLFDGLGERWLYLEAWHGYLESAEAGAGTSDGFEEWSALRGEYLIPEPASILGLGTVLFFLGSRLRRRKKA